MKLYEILGIDDNATQEEIQDAYRKRARETHPDVGGSAEAFHAVNLAGNILRDTAKRIEYDQTGNYEEVGEDPRIKAHKKFIDFFFNVFSTLTTAEDTKHMDLISQVKIKINETILAEQGTIEKVNINIFMLKQMIKRVSFNGDGEGLLQTALKSNLEMAEGHIKKIERNVAELKACIEIANEYSYSREMKQSMTTFSTTASNVWIQGG